MRIFKQAAVTMPISSYANAFFFARPGRVTFGPSHTRLPPRSCQTTVRCAARALVIGKSAALPTIAIHRDVREVDAATKTIAPKNKSPASAGLLQIHRFRLAYFASLAIWCVSRETFRLAVFL